MVVMKVFLIGQRGIPANNYYDHQERRAESVAKGAVERGYEVSVLVDETYGASHLSNWQGADIVSIRGNIGSLGFALRLARLIRRERPEIVHVQGWQVMPWARLWQRAGRGATFLWTIPSLPRLKGQDYGRLLKKGVRLFHSITTPSREVQYLLLDQYGVRAQYIPDGFEEDQESIPVSQWDLRKGQYVVVTATSAQDLGWITEAYSRITTKKKLVVFHPDSAEIKALQEKHALLQVLPVLSERVYHSLLRQAAVVIAASPYGMTEPLLQAMGAERAVVSVNHPLNEEVLGATGQIVLQGDGYALQEALETVITSPKEQKKWGQKAAKRAANHFSWQRVMAEYAGLYKQRAVRRVPMDSLLARQSGV